jgi:hypothetical protein
MAKTEIVFTSAELRELIDAHVFVGNGMKEIGGATWTARIEHRSLTTSFRNALHSSRYCGEAHMRFRPYEISRMKSVLNISLAFIEHAASSKELTEEQRVHVSILKMAAQKVAEAA